MSLKLHVDKVFEKISNFHPTDEMDITEEFVIQKLLDVRATLIRQEQNRKKSLEPYYQHSCCHEMKCFKQSCVIGGVTFTSDHVHHYVDLPKTINGINNPIRYIGSDSGTRYSEVSLNTFLEIQHLEIGSFLPIYTRQGDKLLFRNTNTSGQIFVCLDMIPFDPRTLCEKDLTKVAFPVPSEYNLELLTTKDILSSMGIFIDETSNEDDDRSISDQTRKQVEAQQQERSNK